MTKLVEQRINSKTLLGEEQIESKSHDAEQSIESKTQHGEQCIENKTQLGRQWIDSKTHEAEKTLESKIKDGAQRIEYNVQDGIMCMKQAANETVQLEYERSKADLRRRLVEHYNDNASSVPLSVLDQSLDKRITDIFATPKIHRIEIAKDGKRVKKEQVLTYKEIFYTNDTKSNRRIYVQGEPGSGKLTFA
ncbi:hypothetical protein DPMN_151711 [Dreissena polymorpha]|uniref:Uncharacterized protein n=2 Tax=Dreissena polymorpha TaxID=45954 RepID=A0A9D4FHN6_DREPO|nr:hypothetical protein DPMN_151711 [Dreissena polymorpha]